MPIRVIRVLSIKKNTKLCVIAVINSGVMNKKKALGWALPHYTEYG